LDPASFSIEPGPGYRCLSRGLFTHVAGVLETPSETHECFFLASLAVDKLWELALSADEPWAMHVHFYGPHGPYLPGQEYLDFYDPAQIQE
jgi:hypothetical protein